MAATALGHSFVVADSILTHTNRLLLETICEGSYCYRMVGWWAHKRETRFDYDNRECVKCS